MITECEFYLLGQMHSTELVDEVLRYEGISRNDLTRKAQEVAVRWGLNRLGYNADVFSEIIGAPVSTRVLSTVETTNEFVGSIQRIYRLDLWPKVNFSVCQHPLGYAWGEKFVSKTDEGLLCLADVEPWKCVVQSLEGLAQEKEILFHWGYEKELRLSFFENGSARIFRGLFDFELLQLWNEEKALNNR